MLLKSFSVADIQLVQMGRKGKLPSSVTKATMLSEIFARTLPGIHFREHFISENK